MEFLSTFTGKLLITLFWSMVPVIELRGAIPIGTAMGLDLWLSIVISIIGNMIPVPFIIVFIRKIFEWMRSKSQKLDKVVAAMEAKAKKNRAVVDRYKFWGLVILVAIPLPGTGAWTGALVAAMMEMRLKDAVPAIFFGVLVAGIIVATVTGGIFAFL
ncbi:MAG: small multi-drug export protein [Clostridia bacterium]|nr:small multi-drug export protein [Clostridia bacterium]